MPGRSATSSLAVFVVAASLISASCKNSSPTAPSDTTPPAATPTPTPATAKVQVTINPNPVPFSGQPITDAAGCAGSKNTWFYSQIARETGGASVTFTSRIDKFDGRVVNTLNGLSMQVPANGSLTVQSRWCSSQAVAHTAQSTFMGTDANGHSINVDAPVVNLMSP